MHQYRSPFLPLIALLLTGITAFFAEPHVPYTPSYVVYRYSVAIIIIFVFFRFIAFADKRRAAQLNDVGLLQILHDGAFCITTQAHLQSLGIAFGWLSPNVSIEMAIIPWLFALIGYYAPQQPNGLPNRLITSIPIVTSQNKQIFYTGLIISGILGIIGTFIPTIQIPAFLIPLVVTLFVTSRVKS